MLYMCSILSSKKNVDLYTHEHFLLLWRWQRASSSWRDIKSDKPLFQVPPVRLWYLLCTYYIQCNALTELKYLREKFKIHVHMVILRDILFGGCNGEREKKECFRREGLKSLAKSLSTDICLVMHVTSLKFQSCELIFNEKDVCLLIHIH